MRVRGFWDQEYEASRHALPVDERAMFIFGYWTGCRFGKIAHVEWSQVDLAGRAVRLRDDQTKLGERRILPLVGRAMTCMTRWCTSRSGTRPCALIHPGCSFVRAASTRSAIQQGVVIRWWISGRRGTRQQRKRVPPGCSMTCGALASEIWS